MTEREGDDPRERPARYSRTPNGLLAALIVTVLAVAAFVVFRSSFRDDPELDHETVDYVEPVKAAQENGMALVYPSSLPTGWRVTCAVTNSSPSMTLAQDRYCRGSGRDGSVAGKPFGSAAGTAAASAANRNNEVAIIRDSARGRIDAAHSESDCAKRAADYGNGITAR